jgi:hypothetical protein
MTTRAAIGLVIGLAGWATLAAPAAADGPIRLDEAQLDRITAGTIAAEADALAYAAGDRFAFTTTDAVTKTLVSPFVEVAIVIAHAGAAACCDGPVGARTSAETTGELSVRHDFTVAHANPHINQALSLSVAVGVNHLPHPGPSAGQAGTHAAGQHHAEPRPRGHYGSRPVSARAKSM